MQDAKSNPRERSARKRSPASTRRLMLLLAGIALVLILLVGFLLYLLFSGLSGGERQTRQPLEDYLAEQWPIFRLRSWDPETGALELEYPLRFSYAQMEKYGAAVEELRELPVGNRSTVEALRTAARESVGASLREVTVYGLTDDGQIAYTLFPDGSVSACWEAVVDP